MRFFREIQKSSELGVTLLELVISTSFVAMLALTTGNIIIQTNEFSNQISEMSNLEVQMSRFNRAIRFPKNCALNFHNLRLDGGEAYLSSLHYKVTDTNGKTVTGFGGKPIIRTLLESAHPMDEDSVLQSNQFILDVENEFIESNNSNDQGIINSITSDQCGGCASGYVCEVDPATDTATCVPDNTGGGNNSGGNDNNTDGDGEEDIEIPDMPENPTFDGNSFEIYSTENSDITIPKQVVLAGDVMNDVSRGEPSQQQLKTILKKPVGPSKPFSKNFYVDSIVVRQVSDSQDGDSFQNFYYDNLNRSAFEVMVKFKTARPDSANFRIKELVRLYYFEAFFDQNTSRIICNNQVSNNTINEAVETACDDLDGEYDAVAGTCMLPSYNLTNCDHETNREYLTGFTKDNSNQLINPLCQGMKLATDPNANTISNINYDLANNYPLAPSFDSDEPCPTNAQVPFAIVSGQNQRGWPKVECSNIQFTDEYLPLFDLSGTMTSAPTCANYESFAWDFTGFRIFPTCN